MSQFFTAAILTATVAAGIQFSAPFLLAALGETVGQRSGVLNLGVDGIMLLSAFGSYYTALETGNLALGVLVGIGVGVVMGLVTAFMSVTLKADQGISGIGVYLFGLGLSDLLFVKLVGTPQPVPTLHALDIPVLSRIPALGHMFFKQNLLVYIAFLMVPVLTFVLRRTTIGTDVDATGENPAAADSVGVDVARTRYLAVIFGCTMAGLAGATLLILDGIFQENLTQSAGFIAVALVYFGAWRPTGVMAGSLLYGLVTAVILQWKALGIIPTSAADLAATAPAVITVLALLTVSRRFRAPSALGRPFVRGVT
ncbi:MAG TPA: ABC transporter permease [Acidimicrobiales bacterium]|nr:ABC transporter permease [Acidimicrobiales bacterium]